MNIFKDLFKTEIQSIKYTPFIDEIPKDEIQELLKIYDYLKGKYSIEFDNDLLEFLEKVIKRNKK